MSHDVLQQVGVAEGEVSEEVALCRDVNAKMVAKYKAKKDKFGQCVDQRRAKREEFSDWQAKLACFAEREAVLASALAGLGAVPGENAELVARFSEAVARAKA